MTEKKKSLLYLLGGVVLGAVAASLIWMLVSNPGPRTAQQTQPAPQETEEDNRGGTPGEESSGPEGETAVPSAGDPTLPPEREASQEATPTGDPSVAPSAEGVTPEPPDDSASSAPNTQPPDDGPASASPSPSGNAAGLSASDGVWSKDAIYVGGKTVSYQGRLYKAKWWTQGEAPSSSDVWEDLGVVDGNAPPAQPTGVDNVPIDASKPQNTALTDFKVVGYYPAWKSNGLQYVDFGVLTHVCYAFAIPKSDGTLRDLENPSTAKTLIASAHSNGAKVLLSVGGWSYNDTPLEGTFMEATSTEDKIKTFADNIIAMCDQYGFDGVDMDWEHPRVDGNSAKQYESLMVYLAEKLHKKDKLLTAAVLSGATADGNIYYDAAAHTNAVLNAVDFINIMAYDGGDGERHSQYDFAVNCGNYWTKTRGLPGYKAVLGVPFYARPSWAGYGTILASDPKASEGDRVTYNGMDVYYNGPATIAKKTAFAQENLGGVMIWELTQDTTDKDESLLQTIGKTIR